jgi:hypothetical protein
MPLLAEYALTHDVFESTTYFNDETGSIQLQHLKEVLLSEGLVRDLRNGHWLSVFSDNKRPWHKRGKELLKKLVQQKRLRRCTCARDEEPFTNSEWCNEALASHTRMPLAGIITTRNVAAGYQDESLVACIDQLTTTPWWAGRGPSVRLTRTIDDYTNHLRLVLQCANSVMFIDPHLDPSQRRYGDFVMLLQEMAGRTPAPLIEVHRVCYFDMRDKRDKHDEVGWRNMFNSWTGPLRAASLAAEVFIWDDFHDRYVISDLVGISVPNGFDTTTDLNQLTTWTRLCRNDRDDVQREFYPASYRHTLKHKFRVPS